MFSPQTINQTNSNTNLLKMGIIEGTGVNPRPAVGFALVQMQCGQKLSAGHQEHGIWSQTEEQREAAMLRSEA